MKEFSRGSVSLYNKGRAAPSEGVWDGSRWWEGTWSSSVGD